MSHLNMTPNITAAYAPTDAEAGKFVRLDTSQTDYANIPATGFEIGAGQTAVPRGKYAVLVHLSHSIALSAQTLSFDDSGIINKLDDVTITTTNNTLAVSGSLAVDNSSVVDALTSDVVISDITNTTPVCGGISFANTNQMDAFGRLRISSPKSIFNYKQTRDTSSLFWDTSAFGSSTATQITSASRTDLIVTADAGDYIIKQTKMSFNYEPGKSQLVLNTFAKMHGETGIIKRVGQFKVNENTSDHKTPMDGIYLESNENTLSFNIASSGSTLENVPQSAWNIDKFDGTGTTGITLIPSAAQIMNIDYQWLGAGRVRCGFTVDGINYCCHEFNHANILGNDTTYMRTPNNPICYYIESDGSGAGELRQICSSVIEENGESEDTGIEFSFNTGIATASAIDVSTADVRQALIGIRLKDTEDIKGTSVDLKRLHILGPTGSTFKWELYLNPTIANEGDFIYNDANENSAVQVAHGDQESDPSSTTVSGGILLDSGYGSAASELDEANLNTIVRLGKKIDGTSDVIVLTVSQNAGTNEDYFAAITWKELT